MIKRRKAVQGVDQTVKTRRNRVKKREKRRRNKRNQEQTKTRIKRNLGGKMVMRKIMIRTRRNQAQKPLQKVTLRRVMMTKDLRKVKEKERRKKMRTTSLKSPTMARNHTKEGTKLMVTRN